MAKDDYFVIVYQILSYLYQCLKNGEEIDGKILAHDSSMLNINKNYWGYIFVNLQKEQLIEGIEIKKLGNQYYFGNIKDCCITPKGIGYLNGNSFIQKAKELVKGIAEITPLFK